MASYWREFIILCWVYEKISILPAILLVFLFAGCQGNESNAGATPEAVGKTETAVPERLTAPVSLPLIASDEGLSSSPLMSNHDRLYLVFQGGGTKGLEYDMSDEKTELLLAAVQAETKFYLAKMGD